MKIGLLEDNPAILDYMTTALQMAGYSVESHTASASLLDSLLTGEDLPNPLPYDVVIIDLLLPGNMPRIAAVEHLHHLISPTRRRKIIISACIQVQLQQEQRE